ncbi:ABC transporter substrate-binding protein [Microbacterium sp. DT81.1]|uniref:ABC transporter substrate-binding protein n=1 Tax=Microbacterium sp. DT81.1 TaxID=3393413 RepID=UPI003CF0896D
MIRKSTSVAVAAATVGVLALAGCSPSAGGGGDADGVTLNYALWDTSQVPAYEACAADFEKESGVKVNVTQSDWGSYWTGLSTDFVAGTGPDVFANVTSNYPDYATQGQLVDLTPLIEEDDVDLDAFIPVTLQNWEMDDKYWGLPKDIDAVGLAYDTAAVEAAGIDPATLNDLDWNASDGGSFGELIKALAVDADGNTGLDADFDKGNVTRYGLRASDPNSVTGHTGWGNFAISGGTELLSPNPFGEEWHFGDEAVIDSIAWFQQMQNDGYIQPASLNSSLSTAALFDAGTIALAVDGSWNAGLFSEGKADIAWSKLPEGPNGLRSYTNSLADSINANSKHPDEAWEWVKYLGSAACQDKVATFGVVFPAIAESTDKAIAAYEEKGVDLQPILDTITDPDAPVALPVALKFAQVSQAGSAALQNIFLNGTDPADTLTALDEEVSALYK